MSDFNVKQIVKAVSGVLTAVGPAVLQNINGENWEGAEAYFQVFNKIGVPIAGDVPLFAWRIPASGGFNMTFPPATPAAEFGQDFPTGISVGWSTTDETYTAAAIGGKWWATGQDSDV